MTIHEAVRENISYAGTLRSLNRAAVGTNYKWLRNEISRLNIDVSHFSSKSQGRPQPTKTPDCDVFIENSSMSRGSVKKRILSDRIIEYRCSKCGCPPIWNGEKLTLVLDHINGKRNDNRRENLRFLCPNCNSQGETFAGRNKRIYSEKSVNMVCVCGKPSPSGWCKDCANKHTSKVIDHKTKIEWPDFDKLCSDVWNSSMVKVGKTLGVSDNAVRKHISAIANIPISQVSRYLVDKNSEKKDVDEIKMIT